MSFNLFTAVSILFAALAVFVATLTQAVQRTHVSAAFGSDSNTATNCTAAAPCRFFAAAMSVTDTNGEVIVLDSGGYGAVVITKSVSLNAPAGIYAGITVFSGTNGITINTPNIDVTLKGITINGLGGSDGVSFTQGASLRVQDCTITNMALNGISATAPNAKLYVNDTVVRKNAGSGIYMQGAITASLQGIRAEANGYGIYARSGPVVNVSASTATDNIAGGFTVEAASGASRMAITKSSALRNQTGVAIISASGNTVTLAVADSIIEGNSFYGISDNNSAGGSVLTVDSTKIIHNGYGTTFGAGIRYGNAPGADARNAVLTKNLITDNNFYAVLLQGTNSTRVIFSGNVITQNQSGIFTQYGTGFTFPIKYSRGDNTVNLNAQGDNASDTSSGVAMTPLGAL